MLEIFSISSGFTSGATGVGSGLTGDGTGGIGTGTGAGAGFGAGVGTGAGEGVGTGGGVCLVQPASSRMKTNPSALSETTRLGNRMFLLSFRFPELGSSIQKNV